jgi:hypothetical protein
MSSSSPYNQTIHQKFVTSSSNNDQQQQQQQQQNAKASKYLADYKQIMLELRAQSFDVIRFATYRTASKLRFIQKKLHLHLIDLWNVIETFRDNNLHCLDLTTEIDVYKLESCIYNMYVQLNKRLEQGQHINVDTQTQLLLAWLLNIYDKGRLNQIKVISFKVALVTMCSGKLIDKIKCKSTFFFNFKLSKKKKEETLIIFVSFLKRLFFTNK